MRGLRSRLKRLLVSSLGPALAERISWACYDAWAALLTIVHPDARRAAEELRAMRDRHRGQRCFIIGNGPSLNKMDLTRLRDEYTFGLNRVYLMFDRLGFATTYLVSINALVIEQCGEELADLPSVKFVNWAQRRFVPPRGHAIPIQSLPRPRFAEDVELGVFSGSTVTYVAIQLSFYLGFSEVILIGVDHSFVTQGAPHATVVSVGDDPNHFDPAYFGKGFRWQLPDLDASEEAYWMAKTQFERHGRRILDATVGGKLQVFPKVAYESLFEPGTDGS